MPASPLQRVILTILSSSRLEKCDSLWMHSCRQPLAAAVVWLRLGNCTNGFLFAWLKPFLPEIERRLNAGEKLIEIRDPVKQVP